MQVSSNKEVSLTRFNCSGIIACAYTFADIQQTKYHLISIFPRYTSFIRLMWSKFVIFRRFFFPLQITVSTAISWWNLFAKIHGKKIPYLLKVSSDIPEFSPSSFLLHKTCLISAFVMGYKIWVGFNENRSHIYCVSFHSCTHFTTHSAISDCYIKHLKKAKFNLWIFIDKSQLLHNLARQQISPNIKLSKLPVWQIWSNLN